MAEMQAGGGDILIGRVLNEDDGSILIEVPKQMDREIHLEEGDRFLSLMFVHNVAPQGAPPVVEAWVPWRDGA